MILFVWRGGYGQSQSVDTPAEVVTTLPDLGLEPLVTVTLTICSLLYLHFSTSSFVGPVKTVCLVTISHGATLDGGPFWFIISSLTQFADSWNGVLVWSMVARGTHVLGEPITTFSLNHHLVAPL